MRWAIKAVLFFSSICSVLSTEVDDDSEPFLHIMARSTVYNAGETRAIFCKGKNLPEDIQWYSPSDKIIEERSNKNNRVYVERKKDKGGFIVPLIIHDINITDSGNWTCKSGDLSETIEFIVGVKVIIPDRNVTLEGEERQDIKMTCNAKGYPPPVVVWYKDNAGPIPKHSEKYVLGDDNTLEIKRLDHTDAGQYICKVRQKALSHYTDKTVHLTVQHKPIMYNNITNTIYAQFKTEEVYAILNETKNITCSAIANPPPTYRWYKRINSFDDDPITDEDTVITSEDGTFSVLVLRLRNESYLGEYKCSAKNSRGLESIIFHVSPGTKPNPPDFVSIAGANVSHLIFNVSCSSCPMTVDQNVAPDPENLTILGYSFQLVPVQVDFPPDWEKAEEFFVDIKNPEDVLFTVGPLSNSTTFHARVCTRNAAGASEWVDIVPDPKTTDHAVRLITSFVLLIAAFMFTRCY